MLPCATPQPDPPVPCAAEASLRQLRPHATTVLLWQRGPISAGCPACAGQPSGLKDVAVPLRVWPCFLLLCSLGDSALLLPEWRLLPSGPASRATFFWLRLSRRPWRAIPTTRSVTICTCILSALQVHRSSWTWTSYVRQMTTSKKCRLSKAML